METRLYRGISSTAVVLPEGEALEQVHKSYIEMAIAGRVTDAQRHTFFSIGQHLCRVRGADTVMLGGTDLCLAFEGQDCGSQCSTARRFTSKRSTKSRLLECRRKSVIEK
jgi:aspartate racemase